MTWGERAAERARSGWRSGWRGRRQRTEGAVEEGGEPCSAIGGERTDRHVCRMVRPGVG